MTDDNIIDLKGRSARVTLNTLAADNPWLPKVQEGKPSLTEELLTILAAETPQVEPSLHEKVLKVRQQLRQAKLALVETTDMLSDLQLEVGRRDLLKEYFDVAEAVFEYSEPMAPTHLIRKLHELRKSINQ